jgi:UDP-3-O-[3-hydroxymyristoyl] glucosamine N-acyltransferase
MKLREIAELVGGELIGDGNIEITSVADISKAQPGQLAFFEKGESMPDTSASCVIVNRDRSGERPAHHPPAETRAVASVPLIITNNPKLAFAKVAAFLNPPPRPDAIIYRSAVVVPSAKIGSGVHHPPERRHLRKHDYRQRRHPPRRSRHRSRRLRIRERRERRVR